MSSHIFPAEAKSGFVIRSNKGVRTALILTAVSLVVYVSVTLVSRGNVLAGFACVAFVAIVFFTFYRIEWGLFILLGLVLFFDHFDIPGFDTFTYDAGYFFPFNKLFPGLGIGIVTPMEIHLLILIFAWIVVFTVKKEHFLQGVPVWWAALLFFAWLFGSVVYGTMKGGNLQDAFWEIRSLSYWGLLLFLVPQLVTTKAHVKSIVWVVIAMVTFKSSQIIARFISAGLHFEGYRTLASHEDAVFCVVVFLILIALLTYGGDSKQRNVLLALLPVLLLGFYASNRRAAYAAFGVGLIAFALLLPPQRRKKLMKGFLVFGVLFSIYLAAYWNTYGRMAVVAQAFKSTVFSSDRDMLRGQDYSSGLARKQENYNAAVTFRTAPILGIGFGRKFEQAMRSWGDYAFKGYMMHNQILWMLGKTGAVGFFLFLLFLGSLVAHGSYVFAGLEDPYLKAICAVCVIAVINQVVVSYVDMQLTFYRNMVFLGVLTGMIPALKAIDLRQRKEVAR